MVLLHPPEVGASTRGDQVGETVGAEWGWVIVASDVLGRDRELGAIDAFLTDLGRGPAALVLTGEAGIGKSVLLNSGVAAAETRYGQVLTCRGVEAEASLSFTGLSELFAPVLDQTLASLAPPRRQALEVALLLAEPGDVVPDSHAVGLAVLDVLRDLGERAALVIAVDDLQWIDLATARALQVALRRLRGDSIGLLATVRESLEGEVPIELDRCFADTRLQRLVVGPLGLGTLHQVLKSRLGLDLSRPEVVHVRDATLGNPLFALELGREMQRLSARLQPGQPLPLPGGPRRLLGARLGRLSSDIREVLLIAALASRSTTEVIGAAHQDRERARTALLEAATQGVVELSGDRVRFAHPLFASLLVDDASPEQRRSVHRALADAVSDMEERARHRALATVGPDARVASELAAAGEVAAARGATATAAELYALSAASTADDPVVARARLLQAARLHRLAGGGKQATTILTSLLPLVPSGTERADIQLEMARILAVDPSELVELLNRAQRDADGDDGRVAQIMTYRAGINLLRGAVGAALDDARGALERAERVGDPLLIVAAISRVGAAEHYVNEHTPGLLERGVEIEERCGLVLEYADSARYWLSRSLMRTGPLERSRRMLGELESSASAAGDETSRVMLLWTLGMLEWLAGDWPRALAYANAAHELTNLTQSQHGRAWVGRVKGLVEADLGLVDQARASAEETIAASRLPFYVISSLGVLGRVEFVLGNFEAAGAYLRELPARLLDSGTFHPTAPLWPDTIETLITLGELDRANAYLVTYEAHAERLQSRWAVAAGARCRGLFAAAHHDYALGVRACERAVAELEAAEYPLELARALLTLGTVRRQAMQRSSARTALERALTIFDELGAPLWADKARTELHRVSGRRPAPAELTETEQQVASLAAQGRSNREIAAALFMGTSTVEAHLSRIYRKLGARRAELATRLADSTNRPPK